MARTKKAPGHGHNSALSLDDAAALQLHHSLLIRARLASAAVAKAAYDEKRDEVNQAFATLKGDLDISRKEMERMLELQNMSESEFRAYWAREMGLMANQGLPVGTQLDMFPARGDTADDVAMAYHMGLAAGRRGEFGTPPDTLATALHSEYLKGWEDGVAENAPKLARAQEIIAQRAQASNQDLEGDGDEADDDSDRDDDGDLDEQEIARRARALKSSDFMERSEEPLQAAE